MEKRCEKLLDQRNVLGKLLVEDDKVTGICLKVADNHKRGYGPGAFDLKIDEIMFDDYPGQWSLFSISEFLFFDDNCIHFKIDPNL